MHKEIYLAAPVRTAVGTFNGGLAPFSAVDLGTAVTAECLKRAGVDPAAVNEVILGNILQAGLGQNPARQCAVKAGVPIEKTSFTVNKLCGSGLKAVMLATQSILAGDADVCVAGGMESMTNAPYLLRKARWGCRMGDDTLVDSLIKDGLSCSFGDQHMGMTAENLAERYGLSRQEQDEFACSSQAKAAQAISSGAFKDEILPMVSKGKKGDVVVDTDEHPRPSTMETLAGLRPAFKKDGTVTVGNASGINDGAAALLVVSAGKARELGVTPMARVVSYGTGGVDPSVMGIGPVPATRQALSRAGLTVDDLDLIEANEAFAAQCLSVGRELSFPMEKLNVNGGAIALGHPIGASGARVLVTLLHAMKKRGAKKGLATLCIGGGQGVAMVVESV